MPDAALPTRRAAAEALEERVVLSALYTATLVNTSASIGSASIFQANTSENIAVAPNGAIYAAFTGSSGVSVAASTNRGQSFLTSVQVTSFDAPEAEVAVGSDGTVFVAWVDASSTGMLSRSTDGGATFSTPAAITPPSSAAGALHLAVDTPYVYATSSYSGGAMFVNSANGVGAFSSTTYNSGQVYAGVQVNPSNGEVYALQDNPVLSAFDSTDHGATFSSLPLNPGGAIFYSTYASSFGPGGSYAFVSGGSSGQAYRFDLATGNTTSLTFGTDNDSQGRSLAADGIGNVVDMFSNGGNIQYEASQDLGNTFASTVTVAAADGGNVAINPTNQDIDVIYEQGGNVYLNVYQNELKSPIKNPVPILTSVSPNSAVAGAGATAITVMGSGFVPSSAVDFNGKYISTTFVSSTEEKAVIPASDLTTAGTDRITVYTAGPGGGTSARLPFTVKPADTIAVTGASLSGQEGRLIPGNLATFVDASTKATASQFKATVNWGDGTANSAGMIVSKGNGKFAVTGQHLFNGDNQSFAVTVTIANAKGTGGIAKSTVFCHPSPLDEAVAHQNFTVMAGVQFADTALATFRDQDSLNINPRVYQGTIDWGDGTNGVSSVARFNFTSSTVNVGSYWQLLSRHIYAKPGTFTVTLTFKDTGNEGTFPATVLTLMIHVLPDAP